MTAIELGVLAGARSAGRGASTAGARFLKSRSARAGTALVALVVAFVLVGPLLSEHDAYTSDFVNGVSSAHTPIGPSRAFFLGADRVYRDELVRLAVGGRFSLTVGVLATVLATTLGGAVGLVAGWFEGTDGARIPWAVVLGLGAAFVGAVTGHGTTALLALGVAVLGAAAALLSRAPALRGGPRVNVDVVLMRAVDIGLAFPFLLLVMAVSAALERTTPVTVVAVLGLTGWLGTARVVRAKTMQVRSLDFVIAARAIGRSTWGILWRHVLPNLSHLLIVVATISVAQMILAESVLGYLGVGIAPPQPTWGRMIMEGQDYLLAGPWLVLAPATAIVATVVGFHLLGEGLRDALDPRD